MRAFLGGLVFLGFVAIQVSATLSGREFYPFSPYRMFSRSWSRQDVMESVRLVGSDHQTRTPWQVLPIPFFQANALMYRFFLDPSAPEAKRTLCEFIRKSLAPPVDIQEVQTVYSSPRPREISHSTVFVCAVRKSDI